jgi:hypothetical protein
MAMEYQLIDKGMFMRCSGTSAEAISGFTFSGNCRNRLSVGAKRYYMGLATTRTSALDRPGELRRVMV